MIPTIRPATGGDVEMLGIVAPAACAEAYAGFWQDTGAYARHLATFGPASFAAALAQPDTRLWVAETDGAVVGFATLVLDAPDPIRRLAGGALLSRLYLLGPARALGLGRRLFDAAAEAAVRHGADHIWLESMVAADWALSAYADWGFREIGRTRFEKPVRPGLDGMIIMVRELR